MVRLGVDAERPVEGSGGVVLVGRGFGRRLRLYTRLFTDVYAYDGHFAYAAEVEGDPDDVLRDDWRGLWIGGEARVAWQPLDWLRVVAGGEGRRSLIARLRGEYDSDGGVPHLSADPLALGPILAPHLAGDELVVLKASRGVALERILPLLRDRALPAAEA